MLPIHKSTLMYLDLLGKGWPLNHHFVFDLLFVGSLLVTAVSLMLPKSIEVKRTRETKDTLEQTLIEELVNRDERT